LARFDGPTGHAPLSFQGLVTPFDQQDAIAVENNRANTHNRTVRVGATHDQSLRAASALRSGGARVPARKFRSPAAAIIAALSVDRRGLGTNVGISRRWPWSSRSARNRLLAETPPAMPTLAARNRRAAAKSRSIKAVTTTR